MVKTNDYRNSPTPRSATDMSVPEIDLERARKGTEEMRKSNPKFRRMIDKLRLAAKAIGKGAKMLLMLALTLVMSKHR